MEEEIINDDENVNFPNDQDIITDSQSPMKNDKISDDSSPEKELKMSDYTVYSSTFLKNKSSLRRDILKHTPTLDFQISKKQKILKDDFQTAFIEPTSQGSLDHNSEFIIESSDSSMSEPSEEQFIEKPSSLTFNEDGANRKNHGSNYHIEPLVTESVNCSVFSTSRVPKKGSLLEKAYNVVSYLKKEFTLFSHELNVGLRGSKCSVVSDYLYVENILQDDNIHIIQCSPFSYVSDKTNICISLVVPELPSGICITNIIVVHFPVQVLLDLKSQNILVFAGNRIQVISSRIAYVHKGILGNYNSIKVAIKSKCKRIIRSLKDKTNENILDLVVGHLLRSYHTLNLKVVHVQKNSELDQNAMNLLAMDSENQFCIIKVNHESTLKKNIIIQQDCLFEFSGFKLTECVDINENIKIVAEYYSSIHLKNDYMYTIEPRCDGWDIKFLRTTPREETFTSLCPAILENLN